MSLPCPDLGIEIQSHKQSGSPGLGPLALCRTVSCSSGLGRQRLDAFLQFGFDKAENLFRRHLADRVLRHIAAYCQRYVTECAEKPDIQPGAKSPHLSLESIEFGLFHIEFCRIKGVQVVQNVVALHHTLEAAFPFSLYHVFFRSPCMVVQPGPFPSVIPPVVLLPCGHQIRTQFLYDLSGLYAVIAVLERAEYGPYHIHAGIVVILRRHCTVKRLVQIHAGCI